MKYRRVVGDEHRVLSLPVRGAWIEIPDWGMENAELGVAPRAGSVD